MSTAQVLSLDNALKTLPTRVEVKTAYMGTLWFEAVDTNNAAVELYVGSSTLPPAPSPNTEIVGADKGSVETGGPVRYLSIRQADGAEFSASSISLYEMGGWNDTDTIVSAWRDGVELGVVQLGEGSTNNTLFRFDLTLAPAFAEVDEIRIARPNGAAGAPVQVDQLVIEGSLPAQVESINRVGGPTTNGSSVAYTVEFSQAVTGVDASDFVLSTTGTAAGTVVNVAGSGTTYTVTVNALSGDGTLRLDLKNTDTGIADTDLRPIAGGYTAGQTFTLDRTAPNAATIDSPALTNSEAPVITGTAERGSIVALSIGGAEYEVVAADDGGWLIDLATANPTQGSLSLTINGENTIVVRSTDVAGNESIASTQTLVIDTDPPSVPSITSGSETSEKAPTITGTAEGGSTVMLAVGGAIYSVVAGLGIWEVDLANAVPSSGTLSLVTNGDNSVSVVSIDAAGNMSNAVSQILKIDARPENPNPNPNPNPTPDPEPQDPIRVPVEDGDVPTAGPEAEIFIGGDKTDFVSFLGSRDDYVIEANEDGSFTITSAGEPDRLENIERLQFDDGILALDIDEVPGDAFRLYLAAFSRNPDFEGIGYWVRQLDSGNTDIGAVADSFINSPEFEITYGKNEDLSNDQFVELLYTNTLDRGFDQEGFDYWLNNLDAGETNRADLLAYFANSEESREKVAVLIEDGIWMI